MTMLRCYNFYKVQAEKDDNDYKPQEDKQQHLHYTHAWQQSTDII